MSDESGEASGVPLKAWQQRPLIECARCHRERPHAGRRLCHSCHVLTGLDGTRDNYPRVYRPRELTREDYEFLHGQGVDEQEIAARLGMQLDSLRRVVSKDRK